MNVAIFTNAYRPIVSGVVKAVDFMREGLSRLGHDVYVVAPGYAGYKDNAEWVFRYPSVRVSANVDFPLPIPYAPDVSRAIRKLPLDVIHAQHPFLLGSLGGRLAREKKIPLVFTFHTRYEDYAHYAPFGIPAGFARLFVRRAVSSFVKRCDAIVAPSPSIREMVETYGGKNCRVIPNAIDLESFQKGDGKSVRRKYDLEGKRLALFVGRLAREKNLVFLLHAFSKMRESLPASCLMLCGDGPYRKEIENEAVRLRLKEDVIFTGMIPYENVPDYLAVADLFCTASVSEIKPLSILETMAAGVPVLGVRSPGLSDTVTHGEDGWLVEEDAVSFSQAMFTLFKDDALRRKLGESAKKKAESFGYMEMAKKLEELYSEVSETTLRLR